MVNDGYFRRVRAGRQGASDRSRSFVPLVSRQAAAPLNANAICSGGDAMQFEFMLAIFLMAVGISVAGAGTHLYQGLTQQQAMLRFDGRTVFGMFGNLFMSFVCGPYIMLKMGLRSDEGEAISLSQLLIAALVAFGWAFITGLLIVAVYIAITG